MTAPIFKFRNVRVRIASTDPAFVYGVVAYDTNYPNQTLAPGVQPTDVSAVLMTVQISNTTSSTTAATVNVSAFIDNASVVSTSLSTLARTLVQGYPLIARNSMDPLNGNTVLAANDQLWVQISQASACDVIVSVLEIANAV